MGEAVEGVGDVDSVLLKRKERWRWVREDGAGIVSW